MDDFLKRMELTTWDDMTIWIWVKLGHKWNSFHGLKWKPFRQTWQHEHTFWSHDGLSPIRLNFDTWMNLSTWVDAPPNFLMNLTANPKGENNEKIRSWGTLPSSWHFGGRGACWSFEVGTRNNENKINHSHGPAQTKQ
jgi:hypothetical protein